MAAALLTYTWNAKSVFFEDGIYFTDGDCYARMTRVQKVLEHPFSPLRHHDFENYPQGTTPHTTAPLDFLNAGLSLILKPFSAQALDLAGAYISPLLGALLVGFLWWWSRKVFPAACAGRSSFRSSYPPSSSTGSNSAARSPIPHPPPRRHRLVGGNCALAQHPRPLASRFRH